jgi:hypothetical protein
MPLYETKKGIFCHKKSSFRQPYQIFSTWKGEIREGFFKHYEQRRPTRISLNPSFPRRETG